MSFYLGVVEKTWIVRASVGAGKASVLRKMAFVPSVGLKGAVTALRIVRSQVPVHRPSVMKANVLSFQSMVAAISTLNAMMVCCVLRIIVIRSPRSVASPPYVIAARLMETV
jgi:hypothetical protein